VVPGLSPESQAASPRAGGHLPDGLESDTGPAAGAGARAGAAVSDRGRPIDQLFDVPPMKPPPESDQPPVATPSWRAPLPIVSDGPVLWRSLEELAAGGVPQEVPEHERGDRGAPWLEPPSRRAFFRAMAASTALAGLGGCAVRPPEEIVPYVQAPEEIVPG